ncbi:MAG: hypothetical protein KJN63_08355 [Acidimicrobiia bacterium]|nr:hypothetical protein [Acidimicrobiia bacterium]
MPEIETVVCEKDTAGDANAKRVGYDPQALTALMAVSVALLLGSPNSPDLEPETLAFSYGGGFVPVFAILTVAVWIGALEAIRRFTA